MPGGLRRQGATVTTAIILLSAAPAGAAGQFADLDARDTVDGLRQGQLPQLPVVPERAQRMLQGTTDRIIEPLRSVPAAPDPAPEPNVSAPRSGMSPGVRAEPDQSGAAPTQEPSAETAGPDRSANPQRAGTEVRAGGDSSQPAGGSPPAASGPATTAGGSRLAPSPAVPSGESERSQTAERPPLREAIINVVEALPGWAKAALAALALALLISLAYGARTWRRLVAAERRASTDRLTGIANRTSAEDALVRQLSLSERSGRPLAVVLFDLDHFKAVNDGFGHQTGDAALVAIGRSAPRTLRERDFLARFGGEEFLALLPGTDLGGGLRAAEKLRLGIARTPVDGLPDGLTASFGVAAYPLDGEDSSALLSAADRALYRAKEEGRDRVSSLHIDAAAQPELPVAGEPPATLAA